LSAWSAGEGTTDETFAAEAIALVAAGENGWSGKGGAPGKSPAPTFAPVCRVDARATRLAGAARSAGSRSVAGGRRGGRRAHGRFPPRACAGKISRPARARDLRRCGRRHAARQSCLRRLLAVARGARRRRAFCVVVSLAGRRSAATGTGRIAGSRGFHLSHETEVSWFCARLAWLAACAGKLSDPRRLRDLTRFCAGRYVDQLNIVHFLKVGLVPAFFFH
jgi:hypothetical protein